MASYDQELLVAARLLLSRTNNLKGRLPGARVRRAVSTAYYALFHFLIAEAGILLIGSQNDLRQRRRVFVRSFSHSGIKAALEKVRRSAIDPAYEQYFHRQGMPGLNLQTPGFIRNTAAAFSDAQAKRHDADYNLNERFSEPDAHLLVDRIDQVIQDWRAASSSQDKDFKHVLCMLMLLKGRLRQES